jgi:SecD/SecF fusion protein
MKYIFLVSIILSATFSSCVSRKPQFITTFAIEDTVVTNGQIDTAVMVLQKRLDIAQPGVAVITADYKQRQIKIQSAQLDKEWINDYLLKKGALIFYECYSIADLAGSLQQADKTIASKLANTKTGITENPFLGTFSGIAQPYEGAYGQQFSSYIGFVVKENAAVLKNYFALAQNDFPAGTKILFSEEPENNKKTKNYAVYFVKDDDSKMVAFNHITKAAASMDNNKYPSVQMQFDAYGSYTWKRITTASVNKNIAIVIDDNILSAPHVNEPIEGGNTQISGSFTISEAQDIANILRSGFLSLNLKVISMEEAKTVK